jgi:hypothetical protein
MRNRYFERRRPNNNTPPPMTRTTLTVTSKNVELLLVVLGASSVAVVGVINIGLVEAEVVEVGGVLTVAVGSPGVTVGATVVTAGELTGVAVAEAKLGDGVSEAVSVVVAPGAAVACDVALAVTARVVAGTVFVAAGGTGVSVGSFGGRVFPGLGDGVRVGTVNCVTSLCRIEAQATGPARLAMKTNISSVIMPQVNHPFVRMLAPYR